MYYEQRRLPSAKAIASRLIKVIASPPRQGHFPSFETYCTKTTSVSCPLTVSWSAHNDIILATMCYYATKLHHLFALNLQHLSSKNPQHLHNILQHLPQQASIYKSILCFTITVFSLTPLLQHIKTVQGKHQFFYGIQFVAKRQGAHSIAQP